MNPDAGLYQCHLKDGTAVQFQHGGGYQGHAWESHANEHFRWIWHAHCPAGTTRHGEFIPGNEYGEDAVDDIRVAQQVDAAIDAFCNAGTDDPTTTTTDTTTTTTTTTTTDVTATTVPPTTTTMASTTTTTSTTVPAGSFVLRVTINVFTESGDAVDVPTARWSVNFGTVATSGCTASLPVGASGVFFDSRGAGRRPVYPSDLREGSPSVWVLGLARVDDDGDLCAYTVTPPSNSKPHTPRPAFEHTLYPSPGGTPDDVCCATVTVSDRHGRRGEESVAFVYTIPSPPACPLASTFSGRLVSELTLDANGDGDVDEDDCWVWCPVPDGGTYVIPPNLPHMPTDGVRVGGVWLTETTTPTLTEAVAAWRASADCVPRPPKPLPAVRTGAGVTPDNSSCPGGRRAFDDEVTMNVAASVRRGVGLRIYPLRNDDRRAVSNPDNVPPGEEVRIAISGSPWEGYVVADGGHASFHDAFFDYVPHPWASGRDAFIYEVGPPGATCQAKVTVTFTDSPPQPAYAARDRVGEAARQANISSVSNGRRAVAGNDYERESDSHEEDFEHRVWVTTDGYDSPCRSQRPEMPPTSSTKPGAPHAGDLSRARSISQPATAV